jgi:D-alanyl-D-alanine carboxypeptidase (penicillin-binding protein 5/6)
LFPVPRSLLLLIFLTFTAPLFLHAQTDQFIGIYHSPLVSYNSTWPEIRSQAAVMVDAATGTLLYSKNAHEEIPPASLTKLMTMHLLQNEIESGRASLDDIVPITSESWAINQPPRSSLMFLGPGQTATLRDILLGLAVSSGNDAAVAAALAFTPTVTDFVSIMNSEARRLGLGKTHFAEPSGISEYNMTCAADFAYFCRYYLAMHPAALENYHSVREFSFPREENVAAAFRGNPRTITQYNRNALLRSFPGMDGLKTGYIDEAGYNIALTAERDGSRFIAVILGAPAHPGGDRIRDDDGRRLLSWAFDNFKTVHPVIGDIEGARLWKGKENTAQFKPDQTDSLTADSSVFTAPKDRAHSLWISSEIANPLLAPLPADYPVGALIISDEQGELHRVQLLTVKAYERGNIFKRMWHSLRLFFQRGR